jgi:hypothetical protein
VEVDLAQRVERGRRWERAAEPQQLEGLLRPPQRRDVRARDRKIAQLRQRGACGLRLRDACIGENRSVRGALDDAVTVVVGLAVTEDQVAQRRRAWQREQEEKQAHLELSSVGPAPGRRDGCDSGRYAWI